MEFLYHEFLLLQTLYKRVGKGIDALANKALEIISTLLHMVSLETRSGRVHPSVILDVSFGLYNCTFAPTSHQPSSATSAFLPPVHFAPNFCDDHSRKLA